MRADAEAASVTVTVLQALRDRRGDRPGRVGAPHISLRARTRSLRRPEQPRHPVGTIDLVPTSGEDIDELLQAGKTEPAEYALLLQIDHAEETSRRSGVEVPPWPYHKLALLYRRQGRKDEELDLLRRFAEQRHPEGRTTRILRERLTELEKEVEG